MKNGPYELIIPPVNYPGKMYRGRYAYEHHVVWWENTGQLVSGRMQIHHINGEKRDNRIENLMQLSPLQHNRMHSEQNKLTVHCGYCAKPFKLSPGRIKTRIANSMSGLIFCSRSCQVIRQQKDRKDDKRRHR